MNRKPLVTVLMGSYNPRWDRLRRAVESLRRQTLEDWEPRSSKLSTLSVRLKTIDFALLLLDFPKSE